MGFNRQTHGHMFGIVEMHEIRWKNSVDKAVKKVLEKRKVWWVTLDKDKKVLCIQIQRYLEKQRLKLKDVIVATKICIDCGQPGIIREGRKRCYKCEHKKYPSVRMKIA
jgi:hypothetical protein